LPINGMLDQIGRGFSHHKLDPADLAGVKTNGPGHSGHFATGFRHRARFPDVEMRMFAHQ
jgi:hypothetical protein